MQSLQVPLDATEVWLVRTGQEMNAAKSLVFTTEHGDVAVVTIAGAPIPPTKQFRCLGVGVRLAGVSGTGPLLQQRMERAGELLSRVHGVHGGKARQAEAVATLVLEVPVPVPVPEGVERTLPLGAVAGATWTADRAFRHGLRTNPHCPFCGKGRTEDEDHLYWECSP